MTFYVLTLFPQTFSSVFTQSIIKRAQDKNLVSINIVDMRDFALDKHKTVDDKPYGGGAGMILKADIVVKALKSIRPKPYAILLSASGKKFDQQKSVNLARKKNIALICGHYEGVDARVEKYADETLSIGDYILTGGELPAMVVIDSVIRFIPGVINPKSPIDESFEKGLLEYPHFTRPQNFEGHKVPKILLKGHHKQINMWRKNESVKRTKKNRPDLFRAGKLRHQAGDNSESAKRGRENHGL